MAIIERLQPHTVKIYNLVNEEVVEEVIEATQLLAPSRFDLFAKLYYVRNREHNREEAERVYKEHIKVFNPDWKEPGRDDKSCFEDFLDAFNVLIDCFLQQDFDSSRSLIPVTDGNIILDGAHRTAALAYYDRKVGIAKFTKVKPKVEFDYMYFKERGLSWNILDLIANEMVQWLPNIYVACLWPKMTDKHNAVTSIMRNFKIAYQKTVKVNLASFKQLIAKVYENQSWVNNSDSVNDKSLQCYGFNGKIEFIFFCGNSFDRILSVKSEIREMYGVGKHALHITDNVTETRDIATYVLLETEREKWNKHSAVYSFRAKLAERWFYFKKVQFINLKVTVAKIIGWKGGKNGCYL